MERKHFLDNIRWVTVLLVLLYHVIYFYNNKGVFVGVGGFGDGPQYQDVLKSIAMKKYLPLFLLIFTFAGFAKAQSGPTSNANWYGYILPPGPAANMYVS